MAAVRLHKSLIKHDINSKFLSLNKRSESIPQNYDFREFYLKNNWERVRLYFKARAASKREKRSLKFRPGLTDPFTFPETPFDITLHPLYVDADILHLHWTSRFLDYPSFFKRNKKPVLWTIHDRNPFSGGEHCITNFPYADYQDLINTNLKIKKDALEGQQITIVAPSLEYQKASQESEILGRFDCVHIPHGINSETFRPANKEFCKSYLDLPSNEKTILFVATSLERRLKGFDLLLEALRVCKTKLNVLVIGELDSHVELPCQARLLGSVFDQRIMRMAYCAADLYVSPSLEESFGLSVAESLICGTPVVGFKVGANPELIKDNLNGVIVENKIADDLASAIDFTVNMTFDPLVVRNSIVDYLDEDKKTEDYISLYQDYCRA